MRRRRGGTHQGDDLHESPKGEEDGEYHLDGFVLLSWPHARAHVDLCDNVGSVAYCRSATNESLNKSPNNRR